MRRSPIVRLLRRSSLPRLGHAMARAVLCVAGFGVLVCGFGVSVATAIKGGVDAMNMLYEGQTALCESESSDAGYAACEDLAEGRSPGGVLGDALVRAAVIGTACLAVGAALLALGTHAGRTRDASGRDESLC
jgi:hypothetical protein